MSDQDKSCQKEFLYKALDDGQSTIRFTDTKAVAVIGFWTFFLATFLRTKDIWIIYMEKLNHWTEYACIVIAIVIMLMYLVRSILLAYITLVPKSNPSEHVNRDGVDLKELFYLHGFNYPLQPKHLYKNDPELKLAMKTSDYINALKYLNKEEIRKELIFELQKISYIRNLKIERVNESIALLMKFLGFFGIVVLYFIGKQFITYKGGEALFTLNFDVTLFVVLYIGHKIGDYLFQTEYQAINKTKHWTPLFIHCLTYTIIVTGVAYFFTGFLNWLAIVVIFVSHVIIDNKKFIIWWGKYIKQMEDPTNQKSKIGIFELDQTFHYIIIFFVSFM